VLLMDEDPVYYFWARHAIFKLTEAMKNGVD